jgi:hypothetical protein
MVKTTVGYVVNVGLREISVRQKSPPHRGGEVYSNVEVRLLSERVDCYFIYLYWP